MPEISINTQEDRPAYVRFERVPVEDHAASAEAGRYVARDVYYALITPAYTKDVMKYEVESWFKKMERRVVEGRLKPEWLHNYKKQFEAYKEGHELPLVGTPILGWGVISPSWQEMLVRQGIRTVEDAAAMTEDAIRRFGMGGVEVKKKAQAALVAAKDTGRLVTENAELRAKLEVSDATLAQVKKDFEELASYVRANMPQEPAPAQAQPAPASDGISAADLMDEPEPAAPRRGRPPKG